MEKKHYKPMLKGPYVVINQLIKSIWKATHLEKKLSCMLGGKKYVILNYCTLGYFLLLKTFPPSFVVG